MPHSAPITAPEYDSQSRDCSRCKPVPHIGRFPVPASTAIYRRRPTIIPLQRPRLRNFKAAQGPGAPAGRVPLRMPDSHPPPSRGLSCPRPASIWAQHRPTRRPSTAKISRRFASDYANPRCPHFGIVYIKIRVSRRYARPPPPPAAPAGRSPPVPARKGLNRCRASQRCRRPSSAW